ncbi:MAG: MFS transporter [Clostridiales bacterium]|nr:MFS transporter [Clostridiales bacterium]
MMIENKEERKIPSWLILLLAASCGLIVANLYYSQPLVGPISKDTGISPGMSGLIVTMTQLGYAAGLLFLVPLSDLLENRKLTVCTLLVAIVGLLMAPLAKNTELFFLSAVFIGAGSVAAQVLVPFAAHLAPPKERGKAVGNVMSGLLLGIMLARPAASLITGYLGWRAVYYLSAVIMVVLTVVLSRLLPKRNPKPLESYQKIIQSLWHLICSIPLLRRRALYQAALFGSFSLFWTVVPMYLSQHFHLDQKEIALFGFAGVAGAVAAPIAGRLADKGYSRLLTGIAFLLAASSFGLTHVFTNQEGISLFLFCASAILLDMAVSGNLVLGQQAIYSLGDEIRGRVNGLFMAIFFLGGAAGSALGGFTYARGGWNMASVLGFVLPLAAFLYYLTEKKVRRQD